MGEAKRRLEAQARGVIVVERSPKKTRLEIRLEDQIWETQVAFDRYSKLFKDAELINARAKAPLLADVWYRIVAFAELIPKGAVSKSEAAEFWRNYWEGDLVKALGQVDIRLKESYYFLTRIKGAALKAVEYLARYVVTSKSDATFLEKACSQAISIGESTLEIGLHFQENNIIYWGENLLINRGNDTSSKKGELMISVRHSSNCWNLYPSPDNLRVSLSDYKQAKLALAQYPYPICGELVHSQSSKLAELLGLVIVGKYAYLVK